MHIDQLKRRELIGLLASTAVAWPLKARAQQAASKHPRIGVIAGFRSELFEAFLSSLREAGYVDGQNMLLEARFYGSAPDHLDEVARELVALKCSVIFAANPYAIRAATKATNTIPIVGVDLESDPVASGLVKSLAWASPHGPLPLKYRTPEGCAIRRAGEVEMDTPIKAKPTPDCGTIWRKSERFSAGFVPVSR